MVSSSKLRHIVDVASQVWGMQPIWDVRMPELGQEPVTINALWTDYGLRPNSNNLAFLVHEVKDIEDLEQWKRRLREWPVRGGLLVSEELYLFQAQPYTNDEVEPERLDIDAWHETLVSPKNHLFTPKALSEFRVGQLSLADFEESVSEQSLTFLLRQRTQLDEAFQRGIDAALREIKTPKSAGSSRDEIKGHVIRMAIAYLAARILEDKNFFGSGHSVQIEDPLALLERMVVHTNGFFRKAQESAQYVSERVRQALAAHMGYSVSFVLTDQRDVGRLYERAIKKLPRDLGSEDWGDLNRHYTPVAIAERMLELLPLERLRPEERIIFDPAAGSGSLLLAATSRLAAMTDIPKNTNERKLYLSNHVAGNDLDRYASLVAQLRYFLASESLGMASETVQVSSLLPFPSNFTHEDYENLEQEQLLIKPRVIVANPPFAEEGDSQKAAKFVQRALSWLENGSQFAFVLPQSFLTATTHGIAESRKLLTERCHIWEVCQCPEGTVGIDAEQDTCLIIGSVGRSRKNFPTAARAIFSRVALPETRESGFLGNAWFANINPGIENWASVSTKSVSLKVPVIALGNLFFVFTGVTPKEEYKPVSECPHGVECKLNWRMKWREPNRVWADPGRVPVEERFIRYSPEFLHRPVLDNVTLLNQPKILVSRIANRGSRYPLAVQIDTKGLCPDNNVFCVLPARQAGKYNKDYESPKILPEGWKLLNDEEQRLWLLGILSSELVNELSLSGRSSRQLTQNNLCKIPLPLTVDHNIIYLARQLLERDQKGENIPNPDELRQQLNRLVENSYGNPMWIPTTRTGTPPELHDWNAEHTSPTITVIGQVLDVSEENQEVFLYLSGLVDDSEEKWIPLPQELPGWALNGTVFEAELSADIETFAELAKRPWALRRFRHTPRPYLVNDELEEALRIESLEIPL